MEAQGQKPCRKKNDKMVMPKDDVVVDNFKDFSSEGCYNLKDWLYKIMDVVVNAKTPNGEPSPVGTVCEVSFKACSNEDPTEVVYLYTVKKVSSNKYVVTIFEDGKIINVLAYEVGVGTVFGLTVLD